MAHYGKFAVADGGRVRSNQCAASEKFWNKEGRTYTYDPDANKAREAAAHLLRLEPLYKHRHTHPDKAFHTPWGGYVPF